MKRWTSVLAAVCLLLSGCSGTGGVEQEAAPVEPQQTVVPAAPSQPEPLSERAVSGWQAAYHALLTEKAEQVAHLRNFERPDYDPNSVGAEIGAVSGTYALYDIDKDGVPELLFRCQSGWYTEVYGCRDEQAVLLGGVHTKDASFYHWSGENGLALEWARMGGHTVTKLSLAEGRLAEEVVFEEFTGTEPYTELAETVPGGTYLWENRTLTELPQVNALTLPILHYGKDRTPRPIDPDRDAAAGEAIEEVLAHGRRFYGVSADGFGGGTGWTTLEAYLAPGGVTPYNALPMEMVETVWLDFNGDGQREALLTIQNAEADDYEDTKQVILSLEEDGTVYAYCMNYMAFYDRAGTVFTGKYDTRERDFAVDFDGPQFYCYGAEA